LAEAGRAYTVTNRHGRRRVYGAPNAGFERYPGQGELLKEMVDGPVQASPICFTPLHQGYWP
jgi:hypothetical protein